MATSKKAKAADPLELAKRWAVALAAPIHEANYLPLDTLGGYPRYGTVGDANALEALTEQGGISSSSEARLKLPLYLDAGIAAAYAKARAWRAGLPREARAMGFFSLDTFELQVRQLVDEGAGAEDPAPSPVAIDLARLVYYVGLASRAALLPEHEAWALVARAADLARRTYGSWADFARGIAYGRWLVAGSTDESVRAEEKRVAQLLARKASPWNALPWDLDLAPLAALTRPASGGSGPLKAVRVRVVVHCPECLFPCLLRTTSHARCDECGAAIERASAHAWATAAGLGEQRELDPELEDTQGSDVWRLRSQGDDVELIAHAKTGPACACGRPIHDDTIRASIAQGGVPCACGRTTPVVEAPPAIREADWRALYVLGGPLRVGEPDGWITLLFSQE